MLHDDDAIKKKGQIIWELFMLINIMINLMNICQTYDSWSSLESTYRFLILNLETVDLVYLF